MEDKQTKIKALYSLSNLPKVISNPWTFRFYLWWRRPEDTACPEGTHWLQWCSYWTMSNMHIHSEEHNNKRTLACFMSYFYWYFWAKERLMYETSSMSSFPKRAFSSIVVGRVFKFFPFQKMSTWLTISLLLNVTEHNIKRSQGIQDFHAQFQLRNCSRDAI